MKPHRALLAGGIGLLAVAAGLWWQLHGRAPADDPASSTAGPHAALPALRTLLRFGGDLAQAPRLPGTRIAVADAATIDPAWRPGEAFVPACTPTTIAAGPGSVAFDAQAFTVAASGLYYVGADFAALEGPANAWPRFLYSAAFDPADPGGADCRGGGAVLYARLTAGVRYTLVTAGWMALDGVPTPRAGRYANIVRPWVPPRDDLDGDGRSELLWIDGRNSRLLIQPAAEGAPVRSLGFGDGEMLAVVADLDGDRRQDLVWHDPATGRTSYTPASLLAVAPQTRIELLSDRSWLPVAGGDLDGDGRADLVWTNEASGETHVWLVVDAARGVTAGVRATILADADWRVVAVADLDGDFRADLLWRNGTSGEAAYWLMAGITRREERSLPAPAGWRIVAAGDVDADGRADLLWINEGERANALWVMDEPGRAPALERTLLADTDWRLVAAVDGDGDARADLLWRNRLDGRTAIWRMAGDRVREQRELTAPPDAELLAR